SMYNDPCVRFAMRIRPKISEKPAASRNSSPPRARLFSVWMIQYCTKKRAGCPGPLDPFLLGFEVLRRRPIARIHRVLEEVRLLVRPELADVRVGVDDGVHKAPVLALHLADVDAADDVPEVVELDRTARGVDGDRAHRLHERLLVLDLAVD